LAVPSIYNPELEEMHQFYERRGCKIMATKSFSLIVIPYPCPELTAFGCRIYDKRPEWCRLYDGRRDIAVEGKCLWSKENL